MKLLTRDLLLTFKDIGELILDQFVDQGPPVTFKDIGELILNQFVDQGPCLRILVS